MQYFRRARSSLRRLCECAILLLVVGAMLWELAQSSSFVGQFVGPAGRLVGFGGVLVVALLVAVRLVRRTVSVPVHGLVDYVRSQHVDRPDAPPQALLQRRDETGRLAREIRLLLDALNEQRDALREQTLNDPLTELGNRRLLEQRMDIVLPMTRRARMPLSVLMIDVDHFKAYNDYYGHPAGDECLRKIADVLRDTFRRETDILVRMGGEEFLVVLLDFGLDESVHMAETMRGNLQACAIPHEKSTTADVVTASIGVATIEPGTRIGMAQLVACADAALYRCKAQGRNCSVSSLINDETLAA